RARGLTVGAVAFWVGRSHDEDRRDAESVREMERSGIAAECEPRAPEHRGEIGDRRRRHHFDPLAGGRADLLGELLLTGTGANHDVAPESFDERTRDLAPGGGGVAFVPPRGARMDERKGTRPPSEPPAGVVRDLG